MTIDYMNQKYDIYLVYHGKLEINYKTQGDLASIISPESKLKENVSKLQFKEGDLIDLNKLKIKVFPKYYQASI